MDMPLVALFFFFFLCTVGLEVSVSPTNNVVFVFVESDSQHFSVLQIPILFSCVLLCWSSPSHVHKSILSVCTSIPALQVGSWVPFSRFHIYVLICSLFILWLISPCNTGSSVIHITSTGSIWFLFSNISNITKLSNIPWYTCTTSLLIHLLMDI